MRRQTKGFSSTSPYAGSGSLTREQFLFHETKVVTCGLKVSGNNKGSDEDLMTNEK